MYICSISVSLVRVVTTFSQGWDTKNMKTCSPRKTRLPDPKGQQLPNSIPKKEFLVPNISQ